MPLFIFFHGFGSNAEAQVRFTGFSLLAQAQGFIVAYAESLGTDKSKGRRKGWELYSNRDFDYVQAILRDLQASYSIDSRKIYIGGHSMGGRFALAFASRFSEQIAAMALFAAAPIRHSGIRYAPKRSVATFVVQGDRDRLISPLLKTAELEEVLNEVRSANQAKQEISNRAGIRFESVAYQASGTGAPVVWYLIKGMGHFKWPSPNSRRPYDIGIDLNREMWEFFESHPLR